MTRVRVMSVHGLHRRTAGLRAQDLFYRLFLWRLRRLVRRGVPLVAGGDWNRPVSLVSPDVPGSTWHGGGIIGFLTYGVTVRSTGRDTHGKRMGWTDHEATWIDLELPNGDRIIIVTANLDKERDGDGQYLAYLRWLVGEDLGVSGLILIQEYGSGLASTRIVRVGLEVTRSRRLIVGRKGVHRGVARAWIDLE